MIPVTICTGIHIVRDVDVDFVKLKSSSSCIVGNTFKSRPILLYEVMLMQSVHNYVIVMTCTIFIYSIIMYTIVTTSRYQNSTYYNTLLTLHLTHC